MRRDKIKEKGRVIETLPSLLFRVKLESGEEILAHLGGKMKMNRIKVLPGDKVMIERSKYDEKRGILIFRLPS